MKYSSVSVSDLLQGRRAHLTGRRRKPALPPETWSLQAVSQGLEHLQSFLWGGQKHQLVPHGLLLWNTSMCAKKDQKIKGLCNQWHVIVLTVRCGTCLPISASCFADSPCSLVSDAAAQRRTATLPLVQLGGHLKAALHLKDPDYDSRPDPPAEVISLSAVWAHTE